MGKIKKRTKNLEALLIGNKLNLISGALFLGGASKFFPAVSDIIGSVPTRSDISPYLLEGVIGLFSFFVGTFGIVSNQAGMGTRDVYKKTARHIERFGELRPRFVKTVIEKSENGWLYGHCQLQGVYLAARQYKQLDVFKKTKRRYSKNLVPNF